jgi:hypothetical protein
MKSRIDFQTIKPHLVAIVLFVIVSFGYFHPVLEGKMLRQGDMMAYAGAAQELKELKAETGEYALWTDRMFGGMPTFLIHNPGHANLTRYVHNVLNLNHARPANHLFLYMLGFYMALLLFGVSPSRSIAGAIAYAFSTYFIIIIYAGHITKVMALGYMPLVVASVYHAFKSDRLRGGVLLGLFLSIQIYVNHLQITYYTFIIVALLGLFELISAIKKRKLADFGKTFACLVIGATLALAANLTTLWTVYEYSAFSRGKPNLEKPDQNQTTGLDIDYITAWSYGKGETLNLLVPNLKGGSSHMDLGKNSQTYKVVEQNYGRQTADQFIKYSDTYWGDQPFTSGPVYIGATVIFLFILAMFLLKGNLKWWLLIATILAIILAWGRHFMWFNELIINYLPGYNKFRTVSMTLVIAQFTLPLLAIIAFDKIAKNKYTFAQIKKPLIYSTSIVAGLLLLILIANSSSSEMIGRSDIRVPDIIQKSLQADRLSMLQSDVFRSLLFMLVTSGLIWFLSRAKIKATVATVVLGLLFAADLIPVSLRYAQNDSWVPRTELKQQPFKPTVADTEILKDKEHYRVLNFASNTFNDAATSYFHNSVGGYHGAKMRRYQELIDEQIIPEMNKVKDILQVSPTYQKFDSVMRELNVLNMLNTRYYILSPDNQPIVNPYALGQAWFVDSIVWASGANDEMALLSTTKLENTAVVDKQYENILGDNLNNSNEKSITMKSYSANRLEYSFQSETQALALFSEMYYPKGWRAFVNGEPVEIIRANYLLRGLVLPAGEGDVVFEFHPKSYFVGNVVSYASSALLLLLSVWVLIVPIFRKPKKEVES